MLPKCKASVRQLANSEIHGPNIFCDSIQESKENHSLCLSYKAISHLSVASARRVSRKDSWCRWVDPHVMTVMTFMTAPIYKNFSHPSPSPRRCWKSSWRRAHPMATRSRSTARFEQSRCHTITGKCRFIRCHRPMKLSDVKPGDVVVVGARNRSLLEGQWPGNGPSFLAANSSHNWDTWNIRKTCDTWHILITDRQQPQPLGSTPNHPKSIPICLES